jgi:hypothetical protein
VQPLTKRLHLTAARASARRLRVFRVLFVRPTRVPGGGR